MSHPVKLFHVSEEPHIGEFLPRPDPNGRLGDAVWAIDEAYLPNYLLPRDCPRVTFGVGPATDDCDQQRFLRSTTARRVVAIESDWLERARLQHMYVYEMRSDKFHSNDANAGYYVSSDAVRPAGCEHIRSALEWLLRRDVELRVLKSLWPLHDAVKGSSLEFSMIRMRNAAPRT